MSTQSLCEFWINLKAGRTTGDKQCVNGPILQTLIGILLADDAENCLLAEEITAEADPNVGRRWYKPIVRYIMYLGN